MWQLQQLQRHDVFEQTINQHNMATLVAFAVHGPKELPKLTDRYLDQFTPPVSERDRELDRYRALVAAHRHMVPTEPH